MLPPGHLVADRFEIRHLAGEGGMGTVYYARDRVDDAPVALKILRSAETDPRFQREASILASLRHPAIVRYVAHGTTSDGAPWIAMEWLVGEDLAERLARGPLRLVESASVVRRIASALAAAHARGIVHRDLKPANVYLPDGDCERATLLDFGIARVGGLSRRLTRTGMMIGTIGYMAPEQARGEAEIDARADVFALGCLLFECLTARPAFDGANDMAVLAKVLLGELPRLRDIRPEVPPAVDDLVSRMLAKDPAERPRDAWEAVAELVSSGSIAPPTTRDAPRRAPTLTAAERRLVCLVLVGPRVPPRTDSGAQTAVEASPAGFLEGLRQIAKAYDARLEPLANGGFGAVLWGSGDATDLAARSARCALELRVAIAGAPIALVSARAEFAARGPSFELVDRAANLLTRGGANTASGIELDEVVAGLLGPRFDVQRGDDAFLLCGERDAWEVSRRLLGKPTPCVGREREIGVLTGIFDECCAERQSRAVLITAPAGVGKSRLRSAFLDALMMRNTDADSWLARGDSIHAGSPFGLIEQAISEEMGLQAAANPALRRARLRESVAECVDPRDVDLVTVFLGELCGTPFPADSDIRLRAARQDPLLMSEQTRRAWETYVAGACQRRPVILVLEDLQWGDAPTMRYVDAALRATRDLPFMVIALARPEVHETFPRLWVDRGVQEIRLQGLSPRAGERLVRAVLDDVDSQTVNRIVAQANGNAFHLEELIRSVVEGRSEAPDTVTAMLEARIATLSDDERRVLRAASVFGQAFWIAGIRALLGEVADFELGHWLQTLEEREIVERRSESRFRGETEYTFRHALLREAAYATLTDGDRHAGHRLAGAWLEAAGEQDAFALAEHFERGADRARAAVFFLRAAEQALDGNDFAAVVARAGHGAASADDPVLRGRCHLLRAKALRWLGRATDCEQEIAAAIGSLPRGSAPWCTAVAIAVTLDGARGDEARVEAWASDVLQLEHETTDPEWVQLLGVLEFNLRTMARADLAARIEQEFEKQADAMREVSPGVFANVCSVRALRYRLAGDPDAALDAIREAASAAQTTGNTQASCHHLVNLASSLAEIGQHAEARDIARGVLAASQSAGLDFLAGRAISIVGLALLGMGALDEARAVNEEAVEAAQRNRDLRLRGYSGCFLALTLARAGDSTGALRVARDAIEACGRIPHVEAFARAIVAQALLERGDAKSARAESIDAQRILAEVAPVEWGEVFIQSTAAETLRATGDIDAANRAIAAVRRAILERAASMKNSARRDAFLGDVWENERVLRLARAWIGS